MVEVVFARAPIYDGPFDTGKSMRVGILVECGLNGPEDVLCRRVCELLRVHMGITFEIDIVPMDDKANLIQGCGDATAALFASGCDRVVILWDERPAWPETGRRLCWHNDRQDILASLGRAGVQDREVHLVCIERELESWLLFDERMLSSVLSTVAHPVRIDRQRNPDRMSNPKGRMIDLFRQHRRGRYNDIQHAAAFARCLQDLTHLRRCATFRRFAERVTGRTI
ncbi:MAG: DUF4276 family protein [Thermoguttaceae bacterium]